MRQLLRIADSLRVALVEHQRSNLAQYRIATVNAAKYLQQLNFEKLSRDHKPAPDQDKKQFYVDLQTQALSGPIFNGLIISTVRNLAVDMDKNEVKWFANQMLNGHQHPDIGQLPMVLDWTRATGTDVTRLTFTQAEIEAQSWHENFKGKEEAPKFQTKDVVHEFPGGWTIVEVKDPHDIKLEGDIMLHCVGGYVDRVADGESFLFSLRDPQNMPHCTAETNDNGKLVQIRGKKNSTPNKTYQQYMLNWLLESGHVENWHPHVQEWEASHEEEMKGKIQDHLAKDPAYCYEWIERHGWDETKAKVVLGSEDYDHIFLLMSLYPSKVDMDILKEKAFKVDAKNADFAYAVAVMLHDSDKDPDVVRELAVKAVREGSASVVYNVAVHLKGILTNKELTQAMVDSTDSAAPATAASLAYQIGYSLDLQKKVETAENSASTILDFYESFTKQVNIDSVIASVKKQNRGVFAAEVLLLLSDRIPDPKVFLDIVIEQKDSQNLGSLARLIGRWSPPDKVQEYTEYLMTALEDMGTTSNFINGALIDMLQVKGVDPARLQKTIMAIGSTHTLRQFFQEMLKRRSTSKSGLPEGVDLSAVVTKIAQDPMVAMNAAVDLSNGKDVDPFLDIIRDRLCESDALLDQKNDRSTYPLAVNFLKRVRSSDDDVKKIAAAIIEHRPKSLADLIQTVGPERLRDQQSTIKKAVFEMGRLPNIYAFYTAFSDEDPEELRKFIRETSDLDDEDRAHWLALVDRAVVRREDKPRTSSFRRIISGLRRI